MLRLRTLIVDDEPLAQQLVFGYVGRVPFLECVGCCSTAAEAEDFLAVEDVDLLFLDVQMPGMSGISLAKLLANGDTKPKIVFTTAYEQYAVDGFRSDAVDYLLKPFDFDEFMHAVNKVKYIVDLEDSASEAKLVSDMTANDIPNELSCESFFFVKSEYKLVKIEIENILYIEGLKDYVKIFVHNRPKAVLTLSTLKQMESRLMSHFFVRLHRSYIVNLKKITGVERNGVFVGETRLPIGDGYKQRFQEIMDKMTL